MASPWDNDPAVVPGPWDADQMAGSAPQPAQAQPQAPPTAFDYIEAGPGGALMQPAVRAGQTAIRLPLHMLSTLSDLGGLYPNPVGDALRSATGAVDQWAQGQNQNYENARNKFENPASKTVFETLGGIAPAYLAGGMVGAPSTATSTLGNIFSGAMNGAKGGAVMGAMNDNAQPGQNYWADFLKRSGTGAAIGALTGGAANATAPTAAPPPTTLNIKDAANNMYKAADNAGLVVKNSSLQNLSGDLNNTAAQEGLSKRLHSGALGALQDIQDAANATDANGNPLPITLKGLDLLRQNVGDVAATSGTPGERRIAGIMRDKMDDYLDNLGTNDVLSGNPQEGPAALAQARDLWTTYRKASTVDQMMEKAKNAAGANYTQAGYETALRQQFRALANNPTRMRGFSPDEQAQILQVVRGGPVDNALRSVGRFVTRGPVSGMMTMGATTIGGPVAGAAMTGATELARMGATRGTMNNIEDLQNLIKGYTPQAPSAPAAPGTSNILGDPTVLLRLLQSGLIRSAINPQLSPSANVGNYQR